MFNVDYQTTIQSITDWIRQTITSSGFEKLVIGLSGGVDSALTAALAVHSIGKENVYIAMMPYEISGKQPGDDARTVAKYLEIPKEQISIIDIKEAVDVIASGEGARQAYQNKKSQKGHNDNFIRRGNIMARVRMIYLFDLAKKYGALVCGTENRTEHYLGYFTRFGDEASDLEPIRSLYKTQVWEMAKYLQIPKKIITKAPTAGLWEDQTDEGELGFTYKDADIVLYYYFDKKLSTDEIVKKGVAKEIVIKVLERVAKNDFKHRLPYVYR